MDSIKTYDLVNNTNQSVNFKIQKMTAYPAEKRKTMSSAPHRHDFYTALLIEKGSGKHLIDFSVHKIENYQVHFVSPGQVHQIIDSEESRGYTILFSSQFLIDHNIPLHFIEDLNLFNNYGDSPPLQLSNQQYLKMAFFCDEMITNDLLETKFKTELLAANLKLFLISSNMARESTIQLDKTVDTSNSLLKGFKILVENHYFDWHSTSNYANELNVSPDHLNRIIKSYIGKTAKEYIQTRICIAAKRMLFFSDLAQKEIGFQLGFSEPANFSAFFKKNSGLSPSQFKLERLNQ